MFGDLVDLDFSGMEMPDADWASLLADYDFGDFGGDLFWDTDLGDFVDPSQVDLSAVVDYSPDLDLSGSGSGPVMDDPFSGSLDTSPISTSTSDHLRSREGDMTPAEQISYMDSIQPGDFSGDSSGWGKALAQGLKGLLGGGLGSGLGEMAGAASGSGLVGNVGGGGMMDGGSGSPVRMMAADSVSPGGMMDAAGFSPVRMTAAENFAPGGMLEAGSFSPGGMLDAGAFSPGDMLDAGAAPGLAGLTRFADADPASAVLMRLQADGGAPPPLQGPIDRGPTPVPFTPLVLPFGAPLATVGAPAALPQRLSGLQRLLSERLG